MFHQKGQRILLEKVMQAGGLGRRIRCAKHRWASIVQVNQVYCQDDSPKGIYPTVSFKTLYFKEFEGRRREAD